MAKQIPPDKIISSITTLDDDTLKEVYRLCATELSKREKELEQKIKDDKDRLDKIRSNGGK